MRLPSKQPPVLVAFMRPLAEQKILVNASANAPHIVLIEGSPRRGGNTENLGKLATMQLERENARLSLFSVARQSFLPCTACNACLQTGECNISDTSDEMSRLYTALDACDGLLWITPVFFASVPAQLKMLIDRFQRFYGRRLLYGKPDALRRPAAAFIIGAGGDPFGTQAAEITLKSASQMAEFTLAEPLRIMGPDAPNDILTSAYASARKSAVQAVTSLFDAAALYYAQRSA